MFAAELKKVIDRIPADTLRALDYIAREIPRRNDSKDVEFLRETRELHFRPYRKFLPTQEVQTDA